MSAADSVLVAERVLKAFCSAAFERADVPAADAARAAENLVDADMCGIGSHGVIRLAIYLQRLTDRGTNPRPKPSVLRDSPSACVYDGDNGLGHVVGIDAMQLAIDKARANASCAFVSVRNSNHFGAAGYYARMAARNGMVGIACTIGAINHMAPWGGAQALLGNNPFAIALPTEQPYAVVLDMACSVAARGKILLAAKEGKPIPGDWAVGPDGLPTTDARVALEGLVAPLGGPKGYALTLAIGLISTMLSGAYFGSEVGDLYADTKTAQNSGHLFGVLPVTLFEDMDVYLRRMSKAIEEIHGARRAAGVDRIYLPGEREHLTFLDRRDKGIPIGRALADELAGIGRQLDVPIAFEQPA